MDENPIGEIDIIEGINHQADNIISLHTCDKCRFTSGSQTGNDLRANCALGGDCDRGTTNGFVGPQTVRSLQRQCLPWAARCDFLGTYAALTQTY